MNRTPIDQDRFKAMTNDASTPPLDATACSGSRLTSLDAFRGITIAGMILVNNPGSWSHVYAPLRHAEWHGWTPTDLVFPSFLLIVGVAIPLALGKRQSQGASQGSLVRKIALRSLIIFGIGMFLNAFPFDKDPATLRVPGVLQRIALCYFAAAILYLKLSRRQIVVAIAALLLGYWALMALVPVPGVGPGDLTRPNNLAAWIDRGLLGRHLYKSDYDPEGLLSTLPAIATTLIGVLAGFRLAAGRPAGDRVAGVFGWGTLLLCLGAAWDGWFPINKALWTSSFVLYSAGLSLLWLGVCFWLIEVEGFKRWAWPFLVFGANPIAAYVLSGIGGRVLSMINVPGASAGADGMTLRAWLYEHGFTSWADPTLASLLWAVAYVLVWLAIMSVFHRFKIFIRV